MKASIDYSMVSPCVCIWDENQDFSFDACKFYYLTDKEKFFGSMLPNVLGNLHGEYSNDIVRYVNNAEWAVNNIVHGARCSTVYLEGYSYGSKQGQSFNIGENTGILKDRLQVFGVDIKTIPPKSLKKAATGNGNANKQLLNDVFFDEVGIDMKAHFGLPPSGWNPSSDIIDSYYLAKHGEELINQLEK